MRVKALRGVCIGPGQHLQPGDDADLESATVQFLVSIGAVEAVKDPIPTPEKPDEPVKFKVPEKASGKKEK